jgi:hypothetical protein
MVSRPKLISAASSFPRNETGALVDLDLGYDLDLRGRLQHHLSIHADLTGHHQPLCQRPALGHSSLGDNDVQALFHHFSIVPSNNSILTTFL